MVFRHLKIPGFRIVQSSNIQTLAHEFIVDANSTKKKTLLLLHGLLANKRNLKSFAKLLTKSYPEFQVLLMDLRGHGASTKMPGAEDSRNSSTLFDAAEDIAFTCSQLSLSQPDIICGHSMGGKVALSFLQNSLSDQYLKYFSSFTYEKPQSLWILDSIPSLLDRSKKSNDRESVASVLEAVSKVSLPVSSKQELVDALLQLGTSNSTAQWMTTNLEKDSNGKFNFVFNLAVCEALYQNYSVIDFMPLLDGSSNEAQYNNCPINVVIAGRNQSSWSKELINELEHEASMSDMLNVFHLPKSGHNVHIDDPRGLLEIMKPSLIK